MARRPDAIRCQSVPSASRAGWQHHLNRSFLSVETIFKGLPPEWLLLIHDPWPTAPHQRPPRAGALVTPSVRSPLSRNAIWVAHAASPLMKSLVPSIGSMIQQADGSPDWPLSSPTKPSSG